MKKLLLLTSFILCSLIANGQDGKVRAAFLESYTQETNKKYDKAIDALQEVYLETSYSINLRLGWLTYMKGDFLQSQTYYEKSISIAPKSIEARLGYVYPTSALQNWDDITRVYKEILSIDPNHSVVNYRMGYIQFLAKDWTQSEMYLKNVLSLYPFDYDSNALLGSVYVKQGKIQEAKKHYRIALQYNPKKTEVQELLDKL